MPRWHEPQTGHSPLCHGSDQSAPPADSLLNPQASEGVATVSTTRGAANSSKDSDSQRSSTPRVQPPASTPSTPHMAGAKSARHVGSSGFWLGSWTWTGSSEPRAANPWRQANPIILRADPDLRARLDPSRVSKIRSATSTVGPCILHTANATCLYTHAYLARTEHPRAIQAYASTYSQARQLPTS